MDELLSGKVQLPRRSIAIAAFSTIVEWYDPLKHWLRILVLSHLFPVFVERSRDTSLDFARDRRRGSIYI